MWIGYRAFVFGMKLYAYKPRVAGKFYNFYQVATRVDTRLDETCLLVVIQVFVVELIAVAVALGNFFFAINFESQGAGRNGAFVTAQTHGAAHARNLLLIFHHINYREGRFVVKFSRICLF